MLNGRSQRGATGDEAIHPGDGTDVSVVSFEMDQAALGALSDSLFDVSALGEAVLLKEQRGVQPGP
jgi:hypothetical protein